MPFNQPLSNSFKIKAVLAFILLGLLALNSCGKRKPPLPPVERVVQKVEISGFQRGAQILLSWKMPARNASTDSLLNISRADIYRLAEKPGVTQPLSEADFASRSTLIASLPVQPDDFGLKKLTYTDTLEFAEQSAVLRYAIRFVNNSGQKAGFSNFLLIEPTTSVAEAPKNLALQTTQDALLLTWTKPEANVDGTKPPKIAGYNIYRSSSKNEPASMINDRLVGATDFSDKNFIFGKEYFYFVRSVSNGTDGELVESSESNIVGIVPKDIFSPTSPTAITIAASPGTISIFFAVNPEKDIAGYKIYRSEDQNANLSQWQSLTGELLLTNTFQDKTVEPGKTYFYYLKAFDQAGNASEASEIFSEKAL